MAGALRLLPKVALISLIGAGGSGGFVLVVAKIDIDFAKRMQQYFDHYLMDAPAPMCLSDGVPATLKGEEFGLESAPAEQSEAQ